MNTGRWFLVLLLVGCASTMREPPPPAAPPQAETPTLTRDVHWMRNSAEYQAVVRQTYRLAAERLREIVRDREPGTWAVSVDADETVIDNSLFARELLLAGGNPSDEKWDAWVARRAARPLPGAIEFLQLVRQLGGRIAVVTNRIESHCADTRANFRAHDIPFDVMLCRSDERQKEPRWQRIESGQTGAGLPPLEIVMWLGDNINDFPGQDQSLRLGEPDAYEDFGERFFAFPNPSYGSWEDNPQD